MTEMDQETLDIAQQIDRDIRSYENRVKRNESIRDRIIAKLDEAVVKLTIDPNEEKAMVTEAKMNVVNSLLKALNEVEASRAGAIKLKQKVSADKESEDSLKIISRTVAEYAKSIDTTIRELRDSRQDSSSDLDSRLDQAVTDAGIEVSDGELELTGSSAKDVARDDTDKKEED